MDVVAATEVAPSLIQEWKEDIYKSESSSDVNSESVDGPYDYTPNQPSSFTPAMKLSNFTIASNVSEPATFSRYFRSFFAEAGVNITNPKLNHSVQIGPQDSQAMTAAVHLSSHLTTPASSYIPMSEDEVLKEAEEYFSDLNALAEFHDLDLVHAAGPFDLDHMKSHITHDSLKFLARLAKYSQISYCVESLEDIEYPFRCRIGCTQFPYTHLLILWYEFWTQIDSPVAGYMAVDHTDREIIVMFRGVVMPSDIFLQLDLRQTEFVPSPLTMTGSQWTKKYGKVCKSCKIHAGLYRSYLNTMKHISGFVEEAVSQWPGYKLVFAGHNIGGAMATIVGLDYRLRGVDSHVVSFGAPKIFNLEMAEFFERQFKLDHRTHKQHSEGPKSLRYYRVTRRTDPIVHWPYMRSYQHTLGEVYIASETLGHPRENVIFHCFGRNTKTCSYGDLMDPDVFLFFWDTHFHYFVQQAGCATSHSFFPIVDLRPISNPEDPYS